MTETQAGLGGAARDDVLKALWMSSLPLCLTDPHQPDAPIVYWNQAFEQLTGYSAQEMLGRNGRVLQGPETDPQAVATIRRGLAAGEDVHVEILNYRRDGSSFWASLFISRLVDRDGGLLYHVGTQLDVTDRRKADIVQLQSRRIDIMSGMASKLAHEFNNFMTIVLANLERAADTQDESRRARLISRAREGAQKAAALTDQMLSFAGRQFHDPRIVQVGSLLHDLTGALRLAGGNAVTVEFHLAEAALPVRLDPGQLELALLALVRNAAAACPQGGRITIASRRLPGGANHMADAVEIVVADDGVGMANDVALRATEPFFSTRERGQGTGLGLSMVKGFTRQSGGTLDIRTAPGIGTSVQMVFPEALPPASMTDEGE